MVPGGSAPTSAAPSAKPSRFARDELGGSSPQGYRRFGPPPEASSDSIRKLLEKRYASQPIGAWSCGSVFTNPPGGHAAELIERAGLKGYRIGGAAVSDKHANFIINEGEATAADLEALVRHVQTTVERVHGVRLVPEVRVVGENA